MRVGRRTRRSEVKPRGNSYTMTINDWPVLMTRAVENVADRKKAKRGGPGKKKTPGGSKRSAPYNSIVGGHEASVSESLLEISVPQPENEKHNGPFGPIRNVGSGFRGH